MKVSIAMATYNGEKYLKEQIESIYAQTYKNIEVIVTDDCSTDKTVEILEQYAKSHGLIYFVNESNLGFVKNFEKVISLCQGEYIALSDQDDIWEKDKLEILLSKIGTNLLIHSDCSIIDEEGKIINSYWKGKSGYRINIENLLFSNVITGCTVLFKKELLKTALPFPEGIVYHDWWLGICAAYEDKIDYIPGSLIQYRQHSEQNTGASENKKISLFKVAFSNISNRWNSIDFNKIISYKKQLQNLRAIENNKEYIPEVKVILDDAIVYFEDYLEHKFHIKTFYISMKYHKVLYPYKNYLFLKNIFMEIIG